MFCNTSTYLSARTSKTTFKNKKFVRWIIRSSGPGLIAECLQNICLKMVDILKYEALETHRKNTSGPLCRASDIDSKRFKKILEDFEGFQEVQKTRKTPKDMFMQISLSNLLYIITSFTERWFGLSSKRMTNRLLNISFNFWCFFVIWLWWILRWELFPSFWKVWRPLGRAILSFYFVTKVSFVPAPWHIRIKYFLKENVITAENSHFAFATAIPSKKTLFFQLVLSQQALSQSL